MQREQATTNLRRSQAIEHLQLTANHLQQWIDLAEQHDDNESVEFYREQLKDVIDDISRANSSTGEDNNSTEPNS